MSLERPETSQFFDEEKCSKLYEELLNVFQKHKPTVAEIIVAYGNLGYSLGASIEGYGDKGPPFEEIEKMYYEEPGKLGVAFMLQAFTTLKWYDDYLELRQSRENKHE